MQFNRQEYSMSEQISALRQRLIDDMTIRNMFAVDTDRNMFAVDTEGLCSRSQELQ